MSQARSQLMAVRAPDGCWQEWPMAAMLRDTLDEVERLQAAALRHQVVIRLARERDRQRAGRPRP